jgi:hypothetical protein
MQIRQEDVALITGAYRGPWSPRSADDLHLLIQVGVIAALDYTLTKAASKTVSFTVYARQSDSVPAQTQIAEAALEIDTARLHTYAIVDQLDYATTHSISVAYPARARIWASSGYALQQILDAIQLLLNVHGATSFTDSSHCSGFSATSTPPAGTAASTQPSATRCSAKCSSTSPNESARWCNSAWRATDRSPHRSAKQGSTFGIALIRRETSCERSCRLGRPADAQRRQ